MGIPSYFNFILQNHASIINNIKYVRCDYLFVDSNSLIYDTIHEFENEVPNDNNIIYSKIYEKMMSLINLNKPNILTYICFDGVPPLPKMYQQRQRRFKSVMTKKILNKNLDKTWNTNQITPGTDFMTNLDDFLTEKFKNNPKVKFSGTFEKGEGEHKICDYIRENKENMKNKNKVIYGLDADLVMLGLLLLLDSSNIYLYKETKYFSYISNVQDENNYYFDVNKLGNEIHNFLQNKNIEQSICDYIFLCFLCGNDFLPHLPSINIRNDGIDVLMKIYTSMNKNQKNNIINTEDKTINWSCLQKLFHVFSKFEMNKLVENIHWKLKFKHKIKPLNNEERLNCLPCFDTQKEEFLLADPSSYNKDILHSTHTEHICRAYLKTLEWNWYYYNGILVSNNTYYDHSHGPLFSDLVNYIPLCDGVTIHHVDLKTPTQFNIANNIDISSLTQLYFVLPIEDHNTIIPKQQYHNTHDKVYQNYPFLKNDNFDVDYCLCKYFWEASIILDSVNCHELNSCIMNINNNV